MEKQVSNLIDYPDPVLVSDFIGECQPLEI